MNPAAAAVWAKLTTQRRGISKMLCNYKVRLCRKGTNVGSALVSTSFKEAIR